MGCPCEIHLYQATANAADAIAEQAINEVARLEDKYSRYKSDSLLMRINQAAGNPDADIMLDEETVGLLNYADIAYQQSNGLFDISSGVLRKAWNLNQSQLPSSALIDSLLDKVGWQKIQRDGNKIILPLTDMELDLGGVVKEYAADSVAQLCRNIDVQSGLVDLGGDISIIGPHADGSPWQVGIRSPDKAQSAVPCIPLRHGALATSGDYERFFFYQGKKYSHLLNPKTGWPVDNGLSSVSIIAEQCLVAGTTATIAMLLPKEEAIAWLQNLGLNYYAIDHSQSVFSNISAT